MIYKMEKRATSAQLSQRKVVLYVLTEIQRQRNKFIHASQKNEAEFALMRRELSPNVDF